MRCVFGRCKDTMQRIYIRWKLKGKALQSSNRCKATIVFVGTKRICINHFISALLLISRLGGLMASYMVVFLSLAGEQHTQITDYECIA
jgi:hypothetical protein